MKLSAPIFRLKHRAKLMAREQGIPRHDALDRIAIDEGFRSWSLLAAQASAQGTSAKLLEQMKPGDLVLLGARPRNGKTQLCLRLVADVMKSRGHAAFFSLDLTETEIKNLFQGIGEDIDRFDGRFQFDGSDGINADYMIERLASAPQGTIVIVDYLQLLDQSRAHPELAVQIDLLKAFAKDRGLVMVFIAQVKRDFVNRTPDPNESSLPRLADIRLPNPVDLSVFDRTCFLNDGESHITAEQG